jgi:hypothetical protein
MIFRLLNQPVQQALNLKSKSFEIKLFSASVINNGFYFSTPAPPTNPPPSFTPPTFTPSQTPPNTPAPPSTQTTTAATPSTTTVINTPPIGE